MTGANDGRTETKAQTQVADAPPPEAVDEHDTCAAGSDIDADEVNDDTYDDDQDDDDTPFITAPAVDPAKQRRAE